jgi:osmoprotectant transport system substrate-binding protein
MKRVSWAALVALLALAGCGTSGPSSSHADADLVIGAFDFGESRVMAALYSAVLEREGISTAILEEVASRELMEPALEQARVDVVPEYEGTALRFLLGPDAALPATQDGTHQMLVDEFESRGVTVLEPSRAENKNELVVTRETANRYGLETISDLRPVASELALGGPPECNDRPLCLAGWFDTYGIRFHEFVPLDAAGPLTLGALEGGDIDVAVLFSTTPAIRTLDLVVLDDDKALQPADRVVAVVRTEALAGVSDAAIAALNEVSAALTTQDLRQMNEQVDENGRLPEEVAREWLDGKGL